MDAVPDEETAISIGRAVLLSAFGESDFNQDPLNVYYNEGKKSWEVSGYVHEGWDWLSGPGLVFIRKSDGKILGIYHGIHKMGR